MCSCVQNSRSSVELRRMQGLFLTSASRLGLFRDNEWLNTVTECVCVHMPGFRRKKACMQKKNKAATKKVNERL